MPSLAGHFLVARPSLDDKNFRRTVVLLLQHGPDGAFGVVINRPFKTKDLPFPIYMGGPCKMEGMLLIHGHEEWIEDGKTGRICPGVFLGDTEVSERVTEASDPDSVKFKMISGYSGWGPSQLEGELAQRAWAVVPASGAHVFETPDEDLWTNILPPNIPEPSVN